MIYRVVILQFRYSLKRCIFRPRRKMGSEGEVRRGTGSSFHHWTARVEKLRGEDMIEPLPRWQRVQGSGQVGG
uniref:Uncharacterized protein n=1 Tax=Anguilla anguilla TaxID=7936 RepID=A0A0E9XKK7_ANGAN